MTETIGHCEIVEALGRGGTGIVYNDHGVSHNRTAAKPGSMLIKILFSCIIVILLLPTLLHSQYCKGRIGYWPSGLAQAVDLQGNNAYLGEGGLLEILDKNSLNLLGQLKMPDVIKDILARGNLLYLACDTAGLVIVDISDPSNPRPLGMRELGAPCSRVIVEEPYAYVVSPYSFISVVDISNPHYPRIVSQITYSGYETDVAIIGHFLYASAYGGIEIFDISNPEIPLYLYTYKISSTIYHSLIYAKNGLLYTTYHTNSESLFSVLDASDPYNITVLGSIDIDGSNLQDIYVYNSYAFVARDSYGIIVYDVSDPTNIQYVCLAYSNYFWVNARRVAADDTYIYAAMFSHGLHKYNYTFPRFCYMLSQYYVTNSNTRKTFIHGEYAYGFNEYLRSQPIIDISDLKKPVLANVLDCGYGGPQDIGMYLDYLVLSSYYDNPIIYSLVDPENPQAISFIDSGLSHKSINFKISPYDPYIFMYSSWQGYSISNISDVYNPQLTFVDNDYKVYGGAIYYPKLFIEDESGILHIMSIDNPYNPTELSSITLPSSYNKYLYDGNYLYTFKGLDLSVYDLTDITNPMLINTDSLSCQFYSGIINNDQVIVTGFILDQYSYYSTHGCIQKIDVSDPSNPIDKGSCLLYEGGFDIKYSNGKYFVSNSDLGLNIYGKIKADCYDTMGDVNLNGQITSMDASLVLQHVVGLIQLTPEEQCRADVNENDVVSSLDAAYILMCTVGNCADLPFRFRTPCGDKSGCM